MTYQAFIQNILNTRGRFNCGDEYCERHHIQPKCLGGTNQEDNFIDLFAREHFIAHKLLAEENPNEIKLIQAYNIMAFTHNTHQSQRYMLSPEEYEAARKTISQALKERYKDPTQHPCYGTHLSDERKALISQVNKGNKYCVGRVLSQETKNKIGNANRNPSAETRAKISQSQKARNLNGGNNPRAKRVIRLNDLKIYNCAKECAAENGINYSTFRAWVQQSKNGFMYYDTYLQKQN